jgi:hypothetical protein
MWEVGVSECRGAVTCHENLYVLTSGSVFSTSERIDVFFNIIKNIFEITSFRHITGFVP